MKRTIVAITIALICGNSSIIHAQIAQKEIDKTIHTDTIHIDYKTRYTSNFWDNFYIDVDFAGRMLMGENDSELTFGKRLKPGFSITIGKWLHPDYGIRLNFGGSRLKGWNNGATGIYAFNDGWTDLFDPVEEYWKEQGIDTQNGYQQDIKYFEANADVLFDLYNLFTSNNRLNRRWTTQSYIGVGMLRAVQYHGMEDNIKMGFRIGLIGNYNISKRLGIHLAIGGSITDSNFDGELGKGKKFAGILNGSIGLSYRIGHQGFHLVRLIPQEQLKALNNAITMIRSEQILPGKTIEVTKENKTGEKLLTPSVVFYPDQNKFNEELQMVNIFRIAQYITNNKNAKITIVGNTGGTDTRLAHSRAEKIRDILVNRYGISPNQLSIQTYEINANQSGLTGYEQSVNFVVTK